MRNQAVFVGLALEIRAEIGWASPISALARSATASNGTLIEIEDLTKFFGTYEAVTQAPSGIHLSIERGEYVAIDRNARALASFSTRVKNPHPSWQGFD